MLDDHQDDAIYDAWIHDLFCKIMISEEQHHDEETPSGNETLAQKIDKHAQHDHEIDR
jgi:hypothetical protein